MDIKLIWDPNSFAEFFGESQHLGFAPLHGIAPQERNAVARRLRASIIVHEVQPAEVQFGGRGFPRELESSDLQHDP